MPEALKVGAPPGTQFATSPKGWINHDMFSQWLDFFILNVPSARPILLIYDGHASHLSIDVIEKARANDIHLLCLPAHYTHIFYSTMQSSSEVKQSSSSQHGPSSSDSTSIEEILALPRVKEVPKKAELA